MSSQFERSREQLGPIAMEPEQGPDWKTFWQSPRNRIYFWKVMAAFVAMFAAVIFTLAYAEKRNGFVIESWSLDYLGQPRDFSIPIFAITYFAMAFAIWTNVKRPVTFLQLLIAYFLMQFMKCIMVLCVPLDPPDHILPLSDPCLESLFYAGRVNLKDLFFSGHVATVCMVAMFSRKRFVKIAFWVLAAILAFLMAQQRVHYIVDVISAPLFAWAAVRLSSLLSKSSS